MFVFVYAPIFVPVPVSQPYFVVHHCPSVCLYLYFPRPIQSSLVAHLVGMEQRCSVPEGVGSNPTGVRDFSLSPC